MKLSVSADRIIVAAIKCPHFSRAYSLSEFGDPPLYPAHSRGQWHFEQMAYLYSPY